MNPALELSPQPIIRLTRVSRVFRRADVVIPVLTGIDLTIPEGQFVAFMGPSGSGKSTLLNLISGLDRPTGGRVEVAGQDLGALSDPELADWRARNIGFVFQLYNLLPVLTAFENVELPLLLTPLSRIERRRHVVAALKAAQILHRAEHRPVHLSGGEQQRVCIARAIVTDPRVLIADEPTGDLDRVSAGAILDLFVRLHRDLRKTVVMVTHDPNAAERADLVHHLDKGVLV